MKPPDHLALAALLVEKAAGNEAAVEALLDVERSLDGIVGFHAQQACEKLLKWAVSVIARAR
jgi:HEPN domain-containing protein